MNLTPEQVDLIKRTICKGATDDELALFLYQAQRLGLDPLSRQIHAVKRWDAKQQREVMTIQVGIDGFRVIAERTGDMDGAVGPVWCGPDGVWRDIWLDKEPPVAARVTVYRKGRQHGYVGIAHWAEYCQRNKDGKPQAMWARMQTVMIAKCAEAIALRRACPAELSGLYEPAELPEIAAEQPALPAAQTKQLAPARQGSATVARLMMLAANTGTAVKAICDHYKVGVLDDLTEAQIAAVEKRLLARQAEQQQPPEPGSHEPEVEEDGQ